MLFNNSFCLIWSMASFSGEFIEFIIRLNLIWSFDINISAPSLVLILIKGSGRRIENSYFILTTYVTNTRFHILATNMAALLNHAKGIFSHKILF